MHRIVRHISKNVSGTGTELGTAVHLTLRPPELRAPAFRADALATFAISAKSTCRSLALTYLTARTSGHRTTSLPLPAKRTLPKAAQASLVAGRGAIVWLLPS